MPGCALTGASSQPSFPCARPGRSSHRYDGSLVRSAGRHAASPYRRGTRGGAGTGYGEGPRRRAALARRRKGRDDRAVAVAVPTMTRGLPGAGKSTWAEARVLERPAGQVVRLTKDSLRAMLHAGRWQGDRTERQGLAARGGVGHGFLAPGGGGIVGDTNPHPPPEARRRALGP